MYKNKEHKNLKDNKSVKRDQRKKGTKPPFNGSGNFHKQSDSYKRPLVRCWNCNDNHYVRGYPHKKGDNIHNIQEAIVGDVRKTQRIYVYLEGRKVDAIFASFHGVLMLKFIQICK